MNDVAKAASTANTQISRIAPVATAASSGMQASAAGATAMSRSLHSVQQQTRATATSMGQLSTATGNSARTLSRASAGWQAFRNAGRGAQFAIIGLIGSVNEAVFMIERTIDSNQKVAVAQAEVNRLMAAGQENTKEYSRAVSDLEERQRGAQFTSRIMAQSVLDNVTFGGMLASQLPKVVNEYRRLRQGTADASGVMTQQAGILTRLRTALSSFSGGLIPIPTVARSAAQSIAQFGTSATTTGGALTTLATNGRAVSTSMTPLATVLGNTAVAMRAMGPAAATATAGTLPLVTGMRAVDTTSKTLIPSIGTMNATVASMAPVNAAAAGSTVPLTAGMRAVDTVSKSIMPTLGMVTTATAAMVPANVAAAGSTLPLAAGMRLVDTTSKTLIPSLWGTGTAAAGSGAGALVGAGGWHAFTTAMMNAGRASYRFLVTPLGLVVTAVAGVITAIVALNQNWGGLRTGLSDVSRSVREAYGEFEILWDVLTFISPAAGFIDLAEKMDDAAIKAGEGQEEAAKAAEELKQKLDQLNAGLAESVARLHGYGQGWEAVLQDADDFISEISTSFKQFGSGVQGEIVALQQVLAESLVIDPSGELSRSIILRLNEMRGFRTEITSTFDLITAVVNDSTAEWANKWAGLSNEMGRLPDMLIGLPEHFKTVVDTMVTTIDTGFEEMKLQPAQWGDIFTDMVDGQLTPASRNLIAALDGGQVALANWDKIMATANTNGLNFQQTIAAITQGVAFQGMTTDQVAESLEDLSAAENTAAAEADRHAASVKYQTEALTGLNLASRQAYLDNAKLIGVIRQQGQAFNENYVEMAAVSAGIQTWREELAQAYFSIVETATAFGYFGDTTMASTDAMLQHIAAVEKIDETNTQAIESYYGLSDGSKQYLASLGLTGDAVAQVALHQADFTEGAALAIEVMAGVDAATARNVDGMSQLVQAGMSLNSVIGLTNGAIAWMVAGLENGQIAHAATAAEVESHASAMGQLRPEIQLLAEAMGILSIAGDEVNPTLIRQTEYLQDLDSQLIATEASAREFVIQHGGNIPAALAASGEELLHMIGGMTQLQASQEETAASAEQAAADFAVAWEGAFESASSAMESWSGRLESGIDKMGEEFGEEFEVGLSDIEKKIKSGPAFQKQFWEEIFPEDFISAAIVKGMDMEDITKELKDLKKDVVKEGTMEKKDAKAMFDPIIDFMKHDLKDSFGSGIGTLVGSLPDLEAGLRPKLVGGIMNVGVDAVSAVKQHLVDPITALLGAGLGAETAGPEMMKHLRAILPQIAEVDADLADLLGTAFVDPLTQQERPMKDQVGKLMAILQELGLEGLITDVNLNANAIADVFESGPILTAAQELQTGIITGWQGVWQIQADVAAQMGDVELSGYYQRLADSAGQYTQNIKDQAQANANAAVAQHNMSETLRNSEDPIRTLNDMLDQNYTALNGIAPAVGATAGNYVDLFNGIPMGTERIQSLQERLDANQTALDANATSATDAQGGFNSVGDSSETATPKVSGLTGAVTGLTGAFKGMFASITDVPDVGQGIVDALGSKMPFGTEATTTAPPPPDFTEHRAKWNEYQTFVNTVVNQIGMHILRLTQGMELMLIGAQTAITQMSVLWSGHAVAVGAQINMLGQHVIRLVEGYGLMMTGVTMAMTTMAMLWAGHGMAVGLQVNTIGQHILRLVTGYGLMMTGVLTALTQMSVYWLTHGQSITAIYNSSILPAINAYGVDAMGGLAANVFLFLSTANQNWTNHATVVGTAVDTSGQHIIRLVEGVELLMQGVEQATSTMSELWKEHATELGTAVNQMIGHVEDLASAIEGTMGRIADAMGEAESAAVSLKSAIDALEDKTITVTTVFRTVGSSGAAQSAAQGFEGIVNQPTRFIVGEGSKPEFVSVTPLVGRNARGNPDVRGWFDRMSSRSSKGRTLERAGEGGLGSSSTLGPQSSGLKRPDIRTAAQRKETTLNAFHREVLTYGEEQEYEKLLKKLKKKKWKPSKLSDENEDRLYELEDKILQARQSQIDSIKSAMEQVIPQINLMTDLTSEDELEKWVTTVIPPLSSAPLSMHASAVKAMSIRGRYAHHKDAMKAGRRDQLNWMSAEYERQQTLIEEAEERRLREEEEKDAWIEEHGSKKQKKKLKKKRKKQREEQRRKLKLNEAGRKDFAYQWSADRYYDELAKQADPPVKIPLLPADSGIDPVDPSTLPSEPNRNAKRGLSTIVRKRTNITAGEFGKAERVDITPMGEEARNIAKEVRQEVKHFITGNLNGLGGGAGGGTQKERQVILVNINQPLEVKLREEVIANAVNKSLVKVMSGKR
jgi:hypothetical protein